MYIYCLLVLLIVYRTTIILLVYIFIYSAQVSTVERAALCCPVSCLVLLRAMFRPSCYLFFSTFAVAHAIPASSSQWPYLQIYPPVNESDGRTPLFYAAVFSFGGDYVSIAALPGIQIALDYINSEPSILPGYTLHYTLMDSQVFLS